jgi:PASTA domain-containing protein
MRRALCLAAIIALGASCSSGVTVPNLVGKSRANAEKTWTDAGLGWSVSPTGDYPSNCRSDSGVVIAQSPAPGTRVASGTHVVSTWWCKNGLGPGPRPGWRTYVSSKDRWSISYPNSWYDLSDDVGGSSDNRYVDRYFSTEKGLSGPLGMTDNGLWLTVRTFSQKCDVEYKGAVVENRPITLDSTKTRYRVMGPDSDGSWAALVQVRVGSRCFNLGVLAGARNTLVRNALLIQEIDKTFHAAAD